MLFTSFSFFVLLISTFIIYYLPWNFIRRNQLGILILSSFCFYSYENPSLLFLLMFSVFINSLFSFFVFKGDNRISKRVLILGVIFNISLLALFKYGPLFATTISNDLSGENGILHFLMAIPLPIGISFYTFEGISLLLDLKKGKSILNLGTSSFIEHLMKTTFFISFFPHLIAGPILKARDFYPQMKIKYFKNIPWETSIKQIVLGFFLKMVVADNLNEITSAIQFPFFQGYSSGNLLLLLFGYSIQIFSDFAGYSLIAIGLGHLFGYSLPENFNFPYISSSFSEFWRRWHISLSTWLRDYLYIPLGGNRRGELRTYLNLFIVMFLGGLWHGAAWSYAVWGSAHGFVLMIERYFQSNKILIGVIKPIKIIFVFSVVTILWLLFKLTDFNHVLSYLNSISVNTSLTFIMGVDQVNLIVYSVPVIIFHLLYLMKNSTKSMRINEKIEIFAYSVMLFMVFVDSGNSGDFIYFQF